MELWAVLVLALLKQGLKCDFDWLTELANKHSDVRCLLGLSEFDSAQYFSHRSVVRNVSLLTPELLQELNQLVVREGLQLVGVSEEQALKARVDSIRPTTCAGSWRNCCCEGCKSRCCRRRPKGTGWGR